MVSSLQMVCRALQPLGFSFPSLLPCPPLPLAFHGFCIPSVLAKGNPGLKVNPGHSPCYLLTSSYCLEKAAPALHLCVWGLPPVLAQCYAWQEPVVQGVFAA